MITNLPDKGIFAWECNFVCENFPLTVKTIDTGSVLDNDEETKMISGTLLFKSKATLAKENKAFNKYRAHTDESDTVGIPLGEYFHTHYIFLDENDEKIIAGPFFSIESDGKEYELDEYNYTTGRMTVQWQDGSVEAKEVCLVPFHIYDGTPYFANEDQESPYDKDGSPVWPIITLAPVEDYKEAYDDIDKLLKNTLDVLWAMQHAELRDDDVLVLPNDRPENWPDVKEES